jgi:GNAT superfamily N-acetyltransferase
MPPGGSGSDDVATTGELVVLDEPYDGASAQRLIDALQAEYLVRYGGPDETPVDPREFAAPDGVFLVGYVDGAPVVMGGLRRHRPADGGATDGGGTDGGGTDGGGTVQVEIKRMYVVPEARSQGFARRILAILEERAWTLGADRIVLETGQRQPEAIALYESAGYERIDGFGHYRDAPLSVSFAKPRAAGGKGGGAVSG